MTPEEIRRRCRQVHLIITDNAIFPAENSGIDNSSVPAFRTAEFAERNRRDRDDYDNMIRNAPEVYGRTKTPKKTRRTMAFYLVPASKIDTDKPQG